VKANATTKRLVQRLSIFPVPMVYSTFLTAVFHLGAMEKGAAASVRTKGTSSMVDPTPAFTGLGRVTARIAACEQILRLALGEREVARARRHGDAGPDRYQRYTDKMLKWDFAQLAQRVRTQFALPDDPWIQIFKDAKILRNSVAHDFWSPYYAMLQSDEGVHIIVRHCTVLDRYFEHLMHGLVYATGVKVALYIDFISTREWKDETKAGFDEKLAAAEKAIANLPAWREPTSDKAGQSG
jgi:hypothetical protein